ncbi:MAG TPA: hypothetical protein VFH04_01195 [Nitrososphaeraceae archaeon]|nr:hypothetical protein [Nitrososphaeraceae archaeon]
MQQLLNISVLQDPDQFEMTFDLHIHVSTSIQPDSSLSDRRSQRQRNKA